MNHPIYLIAAVDEKNGLGKSGTIPWNFRSDLKHFLRITTATQDPSKQNLVIMGRTTWESIPTQFRPLKNRLNAVLSSQEDYHAEGARVFSSLDQALRSADEMIEGIFVIGGGSVYAKALPLPRLKGIYLTRIHHAFDCDVFFPPIPKTFGDPQPLGDQVENGVRLDFLLYNRKA